MGLTGWDEMGLSDVTQDSTSSARKIEEYGAHWNKLQKKIACSRSRFKGHTSVLKREAS